MSELGGGEQEIFALRLQIETLNDRIKELERECVQAKQGGNSTGKLNDTILETLRVVEAERDEALRMVNVQIDATNEITRFADGLKQQLAAPAWSQERPTVPGYYFVKLTDPDDGYGWEIHYVMQIGGHLKVITLCSDVELTRHVTDDHFNDHLWAGPIVPPEGTR